MPVKRTEPLATHFWAKVNRDGQPPAHQPELGPCWLWTATCRPKGYGTYYINRYPALAHRVAWELTFGAVTDGLLVLHKCDTPPCVRPDHLFLGSYADNMHDAQDKGRMPVRKPRKAAPLRGEDNPLAKLSATQVDEIRRRYAEGGITLASLGHTYGVHAMTVRLLVRGINWAARRTDLRDITPSVVVHFMRTKWAPQTMCGLSRTEHPELRGRLHLTGMASRITCAACQRVVG